MNTIQSKLDTFFHKPVGLIILFVVIFYLITFLVYYFYSPGPEERRQAEMALTKNQTTSQSQISTQSSP